MSKSFQQIVDFVGVCAEELFTTYLTSEAHAAALGAPAVISNEVGGSFKIFGGDAVRGTNLAIVPGHMIVQTWRGKLWDEDDLDSVLVLIFEETPLGAQILLTHVNVPDHAYPHVNEIAWDRMYWKRWKQYFSANQLPRRHS